MKEDESRRSAGVSPCEPRKGTSRLRRHGRGEREAVVVSFLLTERSAGLRRQGERSRRPSSGRLTMGIPVVRIGLQPGSDPVVKRWMSEHLPHAMACSPGGEAASLDAGVRRTSMPAGAWE